MANLRHETDLIQAVAEGIATAIDSNPRGQYDAIDVRIESRVEGGCASAEFQVVDATGEIFTVNVRRGELWPL